MAAVGCRRPTASVPAATTRAGGERSLAFDLARRGAGSRRRERLRQVDPRPPPLAARPAERGERRVRRCRCRPFAVPGARPIPQAGTVGFSERRLVAQPAIVGRGGLGTAAPPPPTGPPPPPPPPPP